MWTHKTAKEMAYGPLTSAILADWLPLQWLRPSPNTASARSPATACFTCICLSYIEKKVPVYSTDACYRTSTGSNLHIRSSRSNHTMTLIRQKRTLNHCAIYFLTTKSSGSHDGKIQRENSMEVSFHFIYKTNA